MSGAAGRGASATGSYFREAGGSLAGPLAVGGALAAAGGSYAAFGAATRGLNSLSAAVTAAGKKAIETAAKFEELEAAFGTLAGSKRIGAGLFSDIQGLAIRSPFKTSELATEGRKLLGAGVAPGDVTGTLSKLGDISAGGGADLSRIVTAYGQVVAKGRLQAEEMLQLSEAGLGYVDVARGAGLSVMQLRTAMESGKAGADLLTRSITNLTTGFGKFSGAMDARSRTVGGRWDSVTEGVETALGRAGRSFFDRFGVGDFLGRVGDRIQGFDPKGLDAWMGRAADGLKPMVPILNDFFTSITRNVKDLYTVAAPSWKQFGDGLASFATDVLPAAMKGLKAFVNGGLAAAEGLSRAATIVLKVAGFVTQDATYTKAGAATNRLGWDIRKYAQRFDRVFDPASEFEAMRRRDTGPQPFAGKAAPWQFAVNKAREMSAPDFGDKQATAAKGRIDKFFADSADVLSRLFREAADKSRPGWRAALDEMTKGLTDERFQTPFQKFGKDVDTLRLGRLAGQAGANFGLSDKMYGRGLLASFESLRSAAKPVERQAAPLVGSNTVQSESLLTQSMLRGQDQQQPVQELIKQTLDAALAEHKAQTKRQEEMVAELRRLADRGAIPGVGRGGAN